MALRRPSPAGDPFAALAELWIGGLSANHDASCACAGLSGALDPRSIEADFCAILVDRYRREGAHALLDVMVRRASERDAMPFDRWLASLGAANLEQLALTRLLADLRTFLESFAGHAGPRIGVCY